MSRFKIIEILIEKETGRIVNGQAVWEELEKAVGQCEDEDGLVTITMKKPANVKRILNY